LAHILGSEVHADSPLTPWQVPEITGLSMVQLHPSAVFDAAIRDALPAAQAQSLLANSYYRLIADAFAGSADFMAAELVGRLRNRVAETGELLVLDTAPAVSAFDFLDAPSRLAAFTDSAFVRTLKGMGDQARGSRITRTLLAAVLGGQLTNGVAELLSSLHGALVDMRDRALDTLSHLTSASSAFVIVTRPAADQLEPVRLATENLRNRGYELRACVVNQMPSAVTQAEFTDEALSALVNSLDAAATPEAIEIADCLRMLREHNRTVNASQTLAQSLAGTCNATVAQIPKVSTLVNAQELASLIQSAR